MNSEKPIWKYFEDDSSKKEVNIKIENQYVWHEMGHLIGFVITKAFNFEFGEIVEVKLNELEDSSPCVKNNCDIFRPNHKKHNKKIRFGVGEFIYDKRDVSRLIKNLDDPFQFTVYTIYLLSGGLFNIYSLNTNPNKIDFKNCFLDEQSEIKNGTFVARAGNDWTKLRSLIKLKDWREDIFFEFRVELFDLMKKHNIFESFRNLIEDTDSRFNGGSIKGEDLDALIDEIQLKIKVKYEFKDDLKKGLELINLKLQ